MESAPFFRDRYNPLYASYLGNTRNPIDGTIDLCKIRLLEQLDIVGRRASPTIYSGS